MSHGTFCWNELMTHDAEKAKAFYSKTVGWAFDAMPMVGGGGRGMKVVQSEGELESLMQQASSEARAAFGDDTVYLEKYLGDPRHIEFQVFGDGGNP